jgi:hypothetical protein
MQHGHRNRRLSAQRMARSFNPGFSTIVGFFNTANNVFDIVQVFFRPPATLKLQ